MIAAPPPARALHDAQRLPWDELPDVGNDVGEPVRRGVFVTAARHRRLLRASAYFSGGDDASAAAGVRVRIAGMLIF